MLKKMTYDELRESIAMTMGFQEVRNMEYRKRDLYEMGAANERTLTISDLAKAYISMRKMVFNDHDLELIRVTIDCAYFEFDEDIEVDVL